MKHAIVISVSLVILAAVAFAMSGCQSPPPVPPFERTFFGDGSPGQTRAIFDAQAAHGARVDGTLYPRHFDGPALDILGQEKLDLMLSDNAAALPLTVYLDAPQHDGRLSAWTEAVRSYLVDAGLKSDQFKVEVGPNPATLHPSAAAIARLPKTENPPAQNTGSVAPPDAPGAPAAPDSGNLGAPARK